MTITYSNGVIQIFLTNEEAFAVENDHKFKTNIRDMLEARMRACREKERLEFLAEYDSLNTQDKAKVDEIINRRKNVTANAVAVRS